MIAFPNIDPVAISIGPLEVHWYGIMYLLGFAGAYLLGNYRAKHSNGLWTQEMVSDVIFYGALGVILGGRIGYILFYQFPVFVEHPLVMFQIWDGGMSFHGGLIGVILAMTFFAHRYNKHLIDVTDFVAPLVPIGLGAGRIGNFINGELWGKPSTLPWAMIFPKDPLQVPRQPSQLYQFAMEGVLLFCILWFFSKKSKPRYCISGMFLLCYGIFRILAEFVREPDPQIGYLAWGWVTEGQVLSLPMVVIGIILIVFGLKLKKYPTS